MQTINGMRRLGLMRRVFLTAGGALAMLTPVACANPFDTDVKNPNAVIEEALNDPAGATTMVNGQGASVTRALSGIYGPYHTATDELTWIGSREFWKNLDDGDVSDPVNEYIDGAYPYVSEARWVSDFAIEKVIAFDGLGLLRNRRDYVRAHIYGAIIYATIGDMFDDFVVESDRTVTGAPVGEANMQVMYDSAIVMLDRALVVATAVADVELQRQVLALRARAKFSKAAWAKIRPSRTTPTATNARVSDAGATADATAMLALGGGTPVAWRYRLTPTATNLAGINVGFEMNNRSEIRAGFLFINADPTTGPPYAGLAGIKMLDPVTGVASTTVANAIDACCRPAVGNNIPMTVASAREMHLILAEERAVAADDAGFLSRLNLSRSVDGLPPYVAVTTYNTMLEYERKTQLFLQGRRLMDMYRFGVDDPRWLTNSSAAVKPCFLPITYVERLSNPQAPQPNNVRLCF